MILAYSWLHRCSFAPVGTPSLLLPVLFPSSSFAAPSGVCLPLPFAVLLQLPVLLCAVCSSGCFSSPHPRFSFLCFACWFAFVVFPLVSPLVVVAGCPCSLPPSLLFPSPACACETPNKTRHISSDSAYPHQCLASLRAFFATD